MQLCKIQEKKNINYYEAKVWTYPFSYCLVFSYKVVVFFCLFMFCVCHSEVMLEAMCNFAIFLKQKRIVNFNNNMYFFTN